MLGHQAGPRAQVGPRRRSGSCLDLSHHHRAGHRADSIDRPDRPIPAMGAHLRGDRLVETDDFFGTREPSLVVVSLRRARVSRHSTHHDEGRFPHHPPFPLPTPATGVRPSRGRQAAAATCCLITITPASGGTAPAGGVSTLGAGALSCDARRRRDRAGPASDCGDHRHLGTLTPAPARDQRRAVIGSPATIPQEETGPGLRDPDAPGSDHALDNLTRDLRPIVQPIAALGHDRDVAEALPGSSTRPGAHLLGTDDPEGDALVCATETT